LFKPYLKYLQTEEKKRAELETAHKEMEEIKKDAKLEAKGILTAAKQEAEHIKKQGEVLAKQEADNLVNEAKEEAEKIKHKASLDIDNERKNLYSELKDKVLDVALKLNEKLFAKSEANKDFIEKALKEEKI
jgi:F-type H+-transporting ATPase subunit b